MSIASWLTQTAYVAPVTGIDAWGKPTYGAPVARKVRVESLRRMVTNAQGEESVSNHRLWSLDPIALTDRVWLPGANTASAEASNVPLSVAATSDKVGSRTLYRVDL